jgi:hypothetical protein
MTDSLNTDGIVSGTELEKKTAKSLDKAIGSGLNHALNQVLSKDLVAARLKGGVMVVDQNFKVVMIDLKAANFCGVSSGQSQGKRFYSLFPGLLGRLFASELHEVLIAISEKQCSRPSHNTLLDQFADAFASNTHLSMPVLSIAMRAYRDGSNIYGLLRLHFNIDQANHQRAVDRHIKNTKNTPEQPSGSSVADPVSQDSLRTA